MNPKKLVLTCVSCIACLGIVLISCSKSGDKPSTGTPGGNEPDATLTKLGTQIILPAYQQLAAKTAALDAAVQAFNQTPDSTGLKTVQAAFKDAYLSWEASSEFEFGPAINASLTTHFVNPFPTDTTIINQNIGGAAYVLDGIGNYAAQGFPAIDYLLFANGNAYALARFTTAANAAAAKQYLAALTGSLKTKSAAVVNAWSSTGAGYVDKFEQATGVDAGSSLSLLVNSYVQDFDVNLQNYKIGIPIGLYGPSVLPISPQKVEGYYSGLSVQLLVAQVAAYKNIYLGGLNDKVAATTAQNNGVALNDAIKNQLDNLAAKITALPDPLPAGILANAPAIPAAYTEVRKTTVLLKVDMSSALGIKISFQDDDGD